ncbi:hypothetical protein [Lysinibacillus sp. RS5]|uniref:hypothetical protein n=1 Tax=unclassified Lysinibacillus TaxID=2636778 RepID=UPI0035BE56B6
MDKIIDVNSAELTVGESVREMETVKISKMLVVKELVESYRSRLLEKYKMMIFENYEDNFTNQLMKDAVMIMDASEEEILKMFFENAQIKYADMNSDEYFNRLFKAAQCL